MQCMASTIIDLLTNTFCQIPGSLVPADFSGAVFTRAHFQKIAQLSALPTIQLMQFSQHK